MTSAKGKKAKTSKIKKKNITKTKLYKQGKIKKKKQKSSALQIKPVQYRDHEESNNDNAIDSENMLQMIDKKDLRFLKSAVLDPSYSFINQKSKIKERKKRTKAEDIDIIEQEYEKNIQSESQKPKKTRHLLPVKTHEGLVRRTVEVEDTEEQRKEDIEEDKGEVEETDYYKDFLPEVEEDDILERPLSTADILARRELLVTQYKLHIGVLASGLLEDPQTKVKNIALLLDTMIHGKNELRFTIQKLVILSLTEVFKDILPSYQIKHQENSIRLKKDTKLLHDFEKSLLKGYRLFLMRLEKHAKALHKKRGDSRIRTKPELNVAELAISCVIELLERHPYFNYNRNIVQMLTPYLNNPRESVRQRVAEGYARIFKDDKRGEVTLDIVRRINHLVKSRSHTVHKEVVSVLLALRIKDVNLDLEKEAEIKQKKFMTHKQRLLAMSKRERKRSKKLQELEKELLETKAEENKESKQKNLTEVMKVVFTIYFRILKKAPSSKVLSSALEGLAKFAHCINVEFFADLVMVLDNLMDGSLKTWERLHCVQTVFAILSGQGEVLNIDPSRFYTHLYNNLLHIHSGRTYEDMRIVLRIMEVVLIHQRKKITYQRLLAFTKRLSVLATQIIHNGTIAALSVIRRVIQLGKGVDVLLDLDSGLGQGIYDPQLEGDPEHSNAASAAMWELTLLQRHYHPTVRLMAEHIARTADSTNVQQLPADIAKLDSVQLFEHFDPSQVIFRPAVPPPAKHISGNVKKKEDSAYVQDLVNQSGGPPQKNGPMSFHREVLKKRKKRRTAGKDKQ